MIASRCGCAHSVMEGTIQRVCKGGRVLTYIWVFLKEALCSYYIWIIFKVCRKFGGRVDREAGGGVVWGGGSASMGGLLLCLRSGEEALTDTGLEQAEYLPPDRNNVDG